jgi:hypothetical protein
MLPDILLGGRGSRGRGSRGRGSRGRGGRGHGREAHADEEGGAAAHADEEGDAAADESSIYSVAMFARSVSAAVREQLPRCVLELLPTAAPADARSVKRSRQNAEDEEPLSE